MTKKKYRFNRTFIEGLKADGTDHRVWDTHTTNLNLRVSANGVKTYYSCYRNSAGTQRWPRIGRASAFTVDEARKIAREFQNMVDQGRDPVEEARVTISAPTMNELWQIYLDQHARPKKKASSALADERLWHVHLSRRFATITVEAVSLSSIRKMHSDMRQTPGAANRALALLSMMMSFAVQNEWRVDNPCKKVLRYPEHKKERYLSDDEVSSLWRALESDSDKCAVAMITILLLTGARRGEVMNMRWQDLELSTAAPSWTLRAGQQKSERAVTRDFVRPLDPTVAAILTEWKQSQRVASVHWVFPSDRKQGSPRTCFKYAWNRIRRVAGIEDVRIHDLRHSYASFAINAGASLEAIGATLGHKDVRTTLRYAHLKDATLREVVSVVSASVMKASSRRPT
jgi:integrase